MATVEDLERRIAQLERRLAVAESRPAAPLNLQRGRYKAVLITSLAAGGSCYAYIWYWAGTKLKKHGTPVQVWDWYLNEGESIPAKTKVVIAFHHDGRFWVEGAGCLAADNLPADPPSAVQTSAAAASTVAAAVGSETDLFFDFNA